MFELSETPRDTECILVLGGDGTLIRAATGTQELQIPLIGVNMGTLGYLCELEEATVFDALDQLFQDNYTTEERIMLSAAKVGGGEDARLAMNDIVIKWKEFMKPFRLYVYINEKH